MRQLPFIVRGGLFALAMVLLWNAYGYLWNAVVALLLRRPLVSQLMVGVGLALIAMAALFLAIQGRLPHWLRRDARTAPPAG